MEYLCEKIIDKFIKMQIVEGQDKNFYVYCMELLFSHLINFGTVFFVVILMGKLFECCLFLALLLMLKSYCGSIHMKHWYTCYIVTSLLIGIILFLCDKIIFTWGILCFIMLTCLCCIWLFAPYQHPNHLLDEAVIKKCKRMARLFSVVEIVLAMLFKILYYETGVMLCGISMILSTTLLMVGKIIDRHMEKEDFRNDTNSNRR